MNFFVVLASLVMALHLLFILWVVFGALLTHRRPLLRWLHLASLVWGTVVEILPWVCPLTPLENWLRVHAGGTAYQGGFLLHYLDALVYPDVPPGLLTACGVAVCLSISESTLRVSASARCRLVNRIPRENGCKMVPEKAGFILRNDLEGPGASIFAANFFP